MEKNRNRKSCDDCKKHRGWLFIVIFAVLISSVFITILTGKISNPTNTPETVDPSTSFGNSTIGGSMYCDAQLITPNGVNTQQGVSTSAQAPELLINETFDATLSNPPWTVQNNVALDTTQSYGLSTSSLKISAAVGSDAILGNTAGFSIATDEALQAFFWVNITDALDTNEYLTLEFIFTNGSKLIYIIDGTYGTVGSNDRLIDYTASLGGYNDWFGMHIIGIEQDYFNQFGSVMQAITQVRFVSHTLDAGEGIHLDNFGLKRTPKGQSDSFWRDDDSNTVIYFVIIVRWNVTISSDINASHVWLELMIYFNINFGGSQVFPAIGTENLAQDALINVSSSQLNTSNTWTSHVFALPNDGSVYGDHLLYNFSAKAEAFGMFNNSTDWAVAEAELNNFDSFEIWWVDVNGSINVDLYVIVGSVTGVGALGLITYKKKNKKDNIEELYN